MSPATAQATHDNVEMLFRGLIEVAQLSEEEAQDFLKRIDAAITIHFIGRLVDQLSEQDKQLLQEKTIDTQAGLVVFLREHFSPEQCDAAASDATENVLRDFLDKV